MPITGTEGKDKLNGTEAADTIIGAGGADKIFGNGGDDVLAGDQLNPFAPVADPKLTADELYGGAGNDFLIGGAGADLLDGGTGNDTLHGGAGNDVISNMTGNDTVVLSDGTDRVVGFGSSAGAEHDVIDMSSTSFNSLAEFQAGGGTIVQVGLNTEIRFAGVGQPVIVLENINVATIDNSDFIF